MRGRLRSPRGAAPGPSSVRWPLLLSGVAAIAAGQMRRAIGLTPLQSTVTVALAPGAIFASLGPGKLRRAATWTAQMLAYKVAFETPSDRRAALRRRIRIDYPIAADSAIGGGKPPGARLQRRLRRPPRITLLDRVVFFVYAFWELESHLALLWLLFRRPAQFPRAALRLGATYDLTLIGYWLVPTAPPWWSSEKLGRMDGDVRRVVIETKRDLVGQSRPIDEHEMGANPWASMPSDHFATALMTALVLMESDRRLGTAALAYAGALGLALVYLGEHYVVDLAAGGGLAASVYGLEPPVRRAVERLGRLAG